jgi:hypothetical protein
VERVHDEHDRRVVNVQLTDAGRGVLVGMDEHRRTALTRLAGELTEDQLLGLLDGHRALRAARLTVFREPNGLVSVRGTDEPSASTEDIASR